MRIQRHSRILDRVFAPVRRFTNGFSARFRRRRHGALLTKTYISAGGLAAHFVWSVLPAEFFKLRDIPTFITIISHLAWPGQNRAAVQPNQELALTLISGGGEIY